MSSGTIIFICIFFIIFLVIVVNTPLREWLSVIFPRNKESRPYKVYIPRYNVKKLKLQHNHISDSGKLCNPSEYQACMEEENKHKCSKY